MRTVEQSNSFALLGSETIQLETRFGQVERPARDVHAHNLGELVVGQQSPEQLALTAAKVEHSFGTRGLQRGDNGIEPPFVEADGAFDRRLLFVLLRGDRCFPSLQPAQAD